jgi:hypothetical protein
VRPVPPVRKYCCIFVRAHLIPPIHLWVMGAKQDKHFVYLLYSGSPVIRKVYISVLLLMMTKKLSIYASVYLTNNSFPESMNRNHLGPCLAGQKFGYLIALLSARGLCCPKNFLAPTREPKPISSL